MNKITINTTALDDCSVLSYNIKQGDHAFNSVKTLIEQKYKYKFRAKDQREIIREFFAKFCSKNRMCN